MTTIHRPRKGVRVYAEDGETVYAESVSAAARKRGTTHSGLLQSYLVHYRDGYRLVNPRDERAARRAQAVAEVVRGDDRGSVAERYGINRGTLNTWLRAAGVRGRSDGAVTRRVWEVWQATPKASYGAIARRAGSSRRHVARLIHHWKAQKGEGQCSH